MIRQETTLVTKEKWGEREKQKSLTRVRNAAGQLLGQKPFSLVPGGADGAAAAGEER